MTKSKKRVPLCAPVRMTPLRPVTRKQAERPLLPFDDEFWLAQPNVGRRRRMTDAQCTLIHKYENLLRSAARNRATGIDGAGKKKLDPELLAELETIGLDVMAAEVRKFDATGGVTFGAFVRERLNGAMDNYLTRERIKTVPYDEATFFDSTSKGDHRNGALARSRDQWKSEGQERDAKGKRPGKRTKRRRDSTGAYKAKPLGASRDKADRLTQSRDSAAKLERVPPALGTGLHHNGLHQCKW